MTALIMRPVSIGLALLSLVLSSILGEGSPDVSPGGAARAAAVDRPFSAMASHSVVRVASLAVDPTYCWAYEDPPPDCLDGIEGGGGYVEESAEWPWPEGFDIICSYKGHIGLGGVARVSGSSYWGACYATGGCFTVFQMELSYWEALAIWARIPISLEATVIQENGCD